MIFVSFVRWGERCGNYGITFKPPPGLWIARSPTIESSSENCLIARQFARRPWWKWEQLWGRCCLLDALVPDFESGHWLFFLSFLYQTNCAFSTTRGEKGSEKVNFSQESCRPSLYMFNMFQGTRWLVDWSPFNSFPKHKVKLKPTQVAWQEAECVGHEQDSDPSTIPPGRLVCPVKREDR